MSKASASAAAQQQRTLAVALDAQREAALPDGSAWVGASAGSGKTKVLVDRILRLLLADVAPAQILCLTFTKAAAAEMAKRVGEKLSRWAIAADADVAADLRALLARPPTKHERTRARRLFARVLETPGGFKIMTLHAFCQSVLGRFPVEAGLPPHFGVMEARDAAELIRQAQHEVLEAAHRQEHPLHSDLVELAARAGERNFGELVAAILFERFRLHEAVRRGSDLIARVYSTLDVAQDETPNSITATAGSDEAIGSQMLKDLRRIAKAMIDSGMKTDVAAGGKIAAYLADPDGRSSFFDEYLTAFFTKQGNGPRLKDLSTKGSKKIAADADKILGKEADRLERVRERRNACAIACATAALLRIGGAVIDNYERLKSSRALLDFDDLIFKTNQLITERASSAWVLFKLDGGIDHILIDEAQDTSRAQWQVVARLTEEYFAGAEAPRAHPRPVGRSIFAVGDPKQSIFSFQRADPAAFVEMREDFAARAAGAEAIWRSLDLRVSFRSTRAVLDLVDSVFAREAANAGVALDRAPISHIAFRHGQYGRVEIWPPIQAAKSDEAPAADPFGVEAEDTEPSVRLANRIAATIKDLVEGAQPAPVWRRIAGGDPVMTPARYGDVMILVRQRGEFMDRMVTALKRAGVPVAGVDRMVLTEQLAVLDLIALGRFLVLPEDDLNLAALLRSPLFGISEQCLFDLAYDRAGAPLWRRLAERAAGDAELQRIHDVLGQLLARADFVPPYELFADVLDVRGGREKLLARLGPEAQDPIDEFLARALDFQTTHAPSLESFLHWLTATSEEIR
ncbi:MAG: UvrD-helicase domain-containing protein, partial [Alphaproteobacteria bacterium]